MSMRRYILGILIMVIILFYPTGYVFALKPITLKEKNIVDFGTLDADSGGTVGSDCLTTGTVFSFGGCQHGIFQIRGQKNTQVNVSLINFIPLTNGADSATATFSIIQSPPYVLNNKGRLNLEVKGILTVSAGQDSGSYMGGYTVDVEYSNGGGDDDDD